MGRSLPLADVYAPGGMGCTRKWTAGEAFPGPAATDPSLVPKTLTIQAPPPPSSYGGGSGGEPQTNQVPPGMPTPSGAPTKPYDGKKPNGCPESVWKWEADIRAAAEKNGVDPDLLRALVHSESGGNAGAVSRVGAVGLCQIMPATGRALGVSTQEGLLNPQRNLDAGARYLAGCLKRNNGNVALALAAYNAGQGNVNKYHGIPRFPETQNYVRVVIGRMNRYKS